MELGALDGKPESSSVSFDFLELGWHRVLVEGNPTYKEALAANATDAYAVVSAVCSSPTVVHFVPGPYTGGIVEFMSPKFIERFHRYTIWDRTNPRGNMSSLNYNDEDSKYLGIKDVHCLPLADILGYASIRHVNFFVLDTEGGELQILESVDFKSVRFDVICVETEAALRPGGAEYAEKVSKLLFVHGYRHATVSGTPIGGRNTWYVHESFQPSKHPQIRGEVVLGCVRAALSP